MHNQEFTAYDIPMKIAIKKVSTNDENSMNTPAKTYPLLTLYLFWKEKESSDILLPFAEFSNVHNNDRSFNAIRSNLP